MNAPTEAEVQAANDEGRAYQDEQYRRHVAALALPACITTLQGQRVGDPFDAAAAGAVQFADALIAALNR